MSGYGLVTLGSLRAQAQERADMINSSYVSTSEWNANLTRSYKELYDLLVAAYGSDYYVNVPVTFQTNGTSQLYALPDGTTTFTNAITGATGYVAPAFYKLLGVDLAVSPGNPSSYITVKRFNFSDRNRYAVPNFQSFYGVSNLKYRLDGNNIWFTPIPASGQTIQLWYIPQPTNLQQEVIGSTTSSSTTVTCADTSLLATGMKVECPTSTAVFTAGTTISTITTNVSFTLSGAANTTLSNITIRAWKDSTQIDGISGWEEYVVLDAALKAMGKEESDVSLLANQKLAMRQRLVDMAENRDAANPARVGDTQSSDFYWPNGDGWGQY
jgi:hypothetical protein